MNRQPALGLLRAALTAIFGASCSSCLYETNESDLVLATDRVCTPEDSCVVVDQTCGCNSGGTQAAVRADAVSTIDARRNPSQICNTSISNDPSCGANDAICINGVCELVFSPSPE